MSTSKIMKGLAVITLTGTLAGGLAACGGSGGTASPPEPSATATAPAPSPAQPKANPTRDMITWAAAGGMDGLNSIDRCLSAMGDYPTPEQISALSNAVAKARSQPIPASVDPKGAYGAMLAHLQKAVTAFENGDIATGSSELRSDTAYMQTLQQEMKAAGFDVRP